jgi:hemoglobin
MGLPDRHHPLLIPVALVLLGLAGCGQPGTPDQVKNSPLREPGDRTLYDRMGGSAAIYAIADNFIERDLQDPRVNFQRTGHAHPWAATPDSVAQLKMYWAQYFGMLTDGPQVYEGKNMLEMHRGMDISEGEWLAMMEDLKSSLDQLNVAPDDQKDFLNRVAGTHDSIVNK